MRPHPWNDENLRALVDRIYFCRNASERCEILDEIIRTAKVEQREACAKICDEVQRKNMLPGVGAAVCAKFIRRMDDTGASLLDSGIDLPQ